MTGKMALHVQKHLPDLWKEGALFAFSGYDGQTDSNSQFVATVGAEEISLLFHTPKRRRLEFLVPHSGEIRIATGDVLLTEMDEGPLLAVYQSWHTLIGLVPLAVDIRLSFEEDEGGKAWTKDALIVTESANGRDVIVLLRDEERWALAYGSDLDEAVSRVMKGLTFDVWEETEARLQFYQHVPSLEDPPKERLLNKCFSVMKVNTLAPEGVIRQHWSTPDRVPHQAMWLWDSVFHSFAMNRLNPELSWEFLKSVLDTQREDGMIPHTCKVDGTGSSMTQPPLLAWGVWENYLHTKQSNYLRYALPILERYLNWDLTNRDRNGNGLLEWMIEGNPLCRSGESGMDNSPRFDRAAILDAVDFSVFAAQDAHCLGLIANELGETAIAQHWQRKSADLNDQIQHMLWDESEGFYYDRDMDGNFSRVKAVSGFLPLLLDHFPQERADRLIAMLHDPNRFQTAFPIPTTAASEQTYSTDMWRGPVWMNMNYLVYTGLKKHGRHTEANQLAQQSIQMVQKYYEQYGVIFEYFDSADLVPPPECDRKGPPTGTYNIRQKMDVVRDFHWSAALTACLLLEQA
ncbi:amylo-alpha-1,6-glucosidase [Paenibacillus sp. P36]|uniref:amylo-alpha-1,6-glucosidase n=1 Tax=Paenibacillus sp. P36 TaxID=3342538 RepID=UPI0038B254BD